MTDIVERLREVRGVLDNRWPGPTSMDLEAADEIERLRTQLDIAITALRRVVSLAEKNVPKYAQEIASEGLSRVGQQREPS